jgi:hypothetical protein
MKKIYVLINNLFFNFIQNNCSETIPFSYKLTRELFKFFSEEEVITIVQSAIEMISFDLLCALMILKSSIKTGKNLLEVFSFMFSKFLLILFKLKSTFKTNYFNWQDYSLKDKDASCYNL